jgi:DHA2 family multidrug resistance protein
VPPREVTSAAGLLTFMRSTSAAFATSITTTQWEDIAVDRRVEIAGTLNGAGGVLDVLGHAGNSAAQAVRQLDALVQTQAVMLATNRVFFIVSFVFMSAAAAVWLAPRVKRAPMAGGGGH